MDEYIIKFSDDIDTDQIIASQYLLLNMEEMQKHAFETLIPDFSKIAERNKIIVAGENFGCGSSREQAPRVLKSLGIKLIIASSFGRIFYRNSINVGLPVVVCKDIAKDIKNNERIAVDLAQGKIKVKDQEYSCTKIPEHMSNILKAGGLIGYLNKGLGGTTWE